MDPLVPAFAVRQAPAPMRAHIAETDRLAARLAVEHEVAAQHADLQGLVLKIFASRSDVPDICEHGACLLFPSGFLS